MVGLGLRLVTFIMLHEGVSVTFSTLHAFILFYFITTSLTAQPMWQESEEGIPHGIRALCETLKTPELLELLKLLKLLEIRDG